MFVLQQVYNHKGDKLTELFNSSIPFAYLHSEREEMAVDLFIQQLVA